MESAAQQTSPSEMNNSFSHVDHVKRASAEDLAILEKVKVVLAENGALDRFGVHLLHKHFDLAPDEILMEYTNEADRTQSIRVEKLVDLDKTGQFLETQWSFDRATAKMGCVGFCHYNNGHAHHHNRV